MFYLLDESRIKESPAEAISDAAAVLSVVSRLFLTKSDALNDRELIGYARLTDAVVFGLEDLAELIGKRLGASNEQYQRGLAHGRQQGFNEAAATNDRLRKVADIISAASATEVSKPAPDLTEVRTDEVEESGAGRAGSTA